MLRTAIGIGWSGTAGNDWSEVVEYVRQAEAFGVEDCWSPEGWAQDAVTPLGYLAAVTDRIRLGTSVMQVSARVPSMTAMTAMTLDDISGHRFALGLGVSGPQVVEGLHGDSFQAPITRLREHLEIVRMAIRGEKLVYSGSRYELPRVGNGGKALRIMQVPNPDIPIYLGTLGPAGLRLVGSLADGWIGTSFVPEAAQVFLEPIAEGAESVGRSLTDIDLHIRASLAFGDPAELINEARPRVAFILGAMGPTGKNFYNLAYQRAGFPEAARVQELWRNGQHDEAAAAVPDELILQSHFYGDEQTVLERLRAYAKAGITTIRFDCRGDTLEDRLATLERGVDLVRQINKETGEVPSGRGR